MTPNGIGVVALASINGRGSYRTFKGSAKAKSATAATKMLARKKNISLAEARRRVVAVSKRMPGRPPARALAAEAGLTGRRPPIGSGERFRRTVAAIMRRGVSEDRAKAIAASSGRKRLGKAYFQSLASAGRARAASKGARNVMKRNGSLSAAWASLGKGGGSKSKSKGRKARSAGRKASPRRAASPRKARGTKRTSAKKPRGLRWTRVAKQGSRKTMYRRSRGTASAVGIAGKGTVFVKHGKTVRRAKFRQQVAVHMVGGKRKQLRVMFKNGRKARPFNAPPPPPGSQQYGTQEDRDMEMIASLPANQRRKAAQRIFGKAYPSKFSRVKRTSYEQVPRVLGGFRIGSKGRGKSRRPVYTTKGKHIEMWQAVNAPSPLYYRRYPEEFAAARDAILARRTARADALRKQGERLAARASEVQEAGDMYTPNSRRRRSKRSKARGRKRDRRGRFSSKRGMSRRYRKKSGSARRRNSSKRRSSGRGRRSSARRSRSSFRKRDGRGRFSSKRRGSGRRRSAGKRRGSRGMRRNGSMMTNKRRALGRRRGMRRNAALAAYMPSFQSAGAALGGLVLQRVIKYLLSSMALSKIDAVPLEYKGILASLLSAAAVVPVAASAMPEKAVLIGAGALVGLGLDVLTLIVTRVYPDAVMYLAGFGADIPMRNTTGWGSYEPVSGYGVLPYAQAAAGMGVLPYAQAAAGLGIGYKAEAAKYGAMGEYMPQGRFPVQAAAGYGFASYEPVSGGQVFDGIGADQASAEAALNAADAMATPMQAAAGFGDIPSQNIWIPGPEQDPSKAISGYGGEGIFADPTFLHPDAWPTGSDG